MDNKIICICGYKRSGKDTVANYIESKYGYEHKKIAYLVRESVKLIFNLTDIELEDNKEIVLKEWDTTPRKIMQWLGTDIFQYKIEEIIPNLNRKFWIKRFIQDLEDNKNNIVISDIRFIHEYDELKNRYKNIKIIKVINDNIAKVDLHESETEFNNIESDYIIYNNSTIHHLYEKIDEILIE